MKPLRFTRHARNRMRRAKVWEQEVAACLESPNATALSTKGRKNYWRQREVGHLRVTAIEEAEGFAIITVTLRRRGARGD